MTCSTSSSGRRAAAGLAAALLATGAAGCAHPGRAEPRAAEPSARLALFPLENLAGAGVPSRELQVALEHALRARGLDLVSGDLVAQFLARHRVRYTGGVDGPTASAARRELGVDGILLGSIDLHGTLGTPRCAATMRLVSAAEEPEIRWMDAAALAGDDHPGLLGLGLLSSMKEVEDRVLASLVGSLADHLAGRDRPAACPGGHASRPRVHYRISRRFGPEPPRVAVMPFVNESPRAGAGQMAELQVVRHLAAAPGIRVLEPGVVRALLLRSRVIMEGGVTHEAARVAFGALDADVVVSGNVHLFEEGSVPALELSVVALSTRDNRPVWQSTSFDRGDDGVFLFDIGRVSTANALACGIARSVAKGIAEAVRPADAERLAAPPGAAAGKVPAP